MRVALLNANQKQVAAIRAVFGAPDVFTVRPSTFAEINPAQSGALSADDIFVANAYDLLDRESR
jgi:hypothetical protein